MNFRNNLMLKNFIGPMFFGFGIGLLCLYLGNNFPITIFETNFFEIPIKILYTISENFIEFLLFIAPFMILVYTASGVNQIKGDAVKFFIKFLLLTFFTLVLLSFLSLIVGNFIVPNFIMQITTDGSARMEPYFLVDIKPLFNSFTALISGILCGLFFPQDSTVIKIIHESEEWINTFAKKLLIPIMPIWVTCIYAQFVYSSGAGTIFINDVILSFIILLLQGFWLLIMYIFVSKYTKKALKTVTLAGLKLYLKVTSIMGLGTGIIIPFAIEAQEEIGVNQDVAKVISVSSLNLPGSLISNIIFAYGVIVMYGLEINNYMMFLYAIALIFATMIAPAVPGGVFSVTSTLLTPILGFSTEQIGLMGGMYYKQGTSNSAANNAADVYLGPLMDYHKKV